MLGALPESERIIANRRPHPQDRDVVDACVPVKLGATAPIGGPTRPATGARLVADLEGRNLPLFALQVVTLESQKSRCAVVRGLWICSSAKG